jgi:hypothetical protein
MVFEGCRHGLNGSIEGLKDGLQEVPEGGKWSKRHLSFPGNLCLHLRDISAPMQCKKRLKNPIPTLVQGITGFRVPLHSPICSLSLLFSPTKFSTNKILPTCAVGVCLCFHPQSRLKNPEHLKFLRVSSMHQYAYLASWDPKFNFKYPSSPPKKCLSF